MIGAYVSTEKVCSLSLGERAGVRGYGASEVRDPLTRRCAPTSPRWGEVKLRLGALSNWRRQGVI